MISLQVIRCTLSNGDLRITDFLLRVFVFYFLKEGESKLRGKEAEEWGVKIVQKLHKKRQRFETTEDYRQFLGEKIKKRSRIEESVQAEKIKLKMLSEVLDQNVAEGILT